MRKRQLPTVSAELLPAEIIPDRSSSTPEKEFRAKEKEAMIQNLMKDLKPRDRATIVLRYWHECSEMEIAEMLDLSVSAVKSRLYRSRRLLAEAWLNSENATEVNERRPYESPAF